MWLLFAHYKLIGDPPGPIDMLSLLKKDSTVPGGWRAKKNLLPPSTKFGEERPGHYRRISLEAWIQLVDLYGLDGYALAVVMFPFFLQTCLPLRLIEFRTLSCSPMQRGSPFDDTSRWRVFKDPRAIDIVSMFLVLFALLPFFTTCASPIRIYYLSLLLRKKKKRKRKESLRQEIL